MNQPFESAVAAPKRLAAQVVEAISRAEIDIQIATAKQYPRVVSKCLETAKELATIDEETAASCFYHIPRDGKVISGPSVRLAEIVAYSWGNLRIATRIVDETDGHITAQAVCHDLQTNVAQSRETRVKTRGKDGRSYSEDMKAVTANAACSKAMRDVIFDLIPLAILNPVLTSAKQVAGGSEKTLSASRAAMIAYFDKLGVPKKRVLAAVSKREVDDLTIEDLTVLRGFATAIKDGEAKLDDVFPDPTKVVASVADKIKAGAKPTLVPAIVTPSEGRAPISDEEAGPLAASLVATADEMLNAQQPMSPPDDQWMTPEETAAIDDSQPPFVATNTERFVPLARLSELKIGDEFRTSGILVKAEEKKGKKSPYWRITLKSTLGQSLSFTYFHAGPLHEGVVDGIMVDATGGKVTEYNDAPQYSIRGLEVHAQ